MFDADYFSFGHLLNHHISQEIASLCLISSLEMMAQFLQVLNQEWN